MASRRRHSTVGEPTAVCSQDATPSLPDQLHPSRTPQHSSAAATGASAAVNDASVAAVFPSLAAQWHPERNSPLLPTTAAIYDRTCVWWRCSRNPSHEWFEPIRARLRLRSTTRAEYMRAYTRAKKANGEQGVEAQTTATTPMESSVDAPSTAYTPLHAIAKLLAESRGQSPPEASTLQAWNDDSGAVSRTHVERSPFMWQGWNTHSRALGPHAHSHIAIAWTEMRIPRIDHSPAPIMRNLNVEQLRALYRVRDCPECASERNRARSGGGGRGSEGEADVTGHRTLESVKPLLAREWHPELNGSLTPAKIAPTADINVWWQCSVDPLTHVWLSHLCDRSTSRTPSCPYCRNQYPHSSNNLALSAPEITYRFDTFRNGRSAQMAVAPVRSHARYWYSVDAPWLGRVGTTLAARMRHAGYTLADHNLKQVQTGASAMQTTLSKSSWLRDDLQRLIAQHNLALSIPTAEASDSLLHTAGGPMGRGILLPVATAQKMERGGLWLPLQRLLDNEGARAGATAAVHKFAFARTVADLKVTREGEGPGAYVRNLLEALPQQLDPRDLAWSDVCAFVPTLHACASIAWDRAPAPDGGMAVQRDSAGSMHPFGEAAMHAYFVLIQVLQAMREGRNVAAALRSPTLMRTLHLLDPTVDHAALRRQQRRDEKRERSRARSSAEGGSTL